MIRYEKFLLFFFHGLFHVYHLSLHTGNSICLWDCLGAPEKKLKDDTGSQTLKIGLMHILEFLLIGDGPTYN